MTIIQPLLMKWALTFAMTTIHRFHNKEFNGRRLSSIKDLRDIKRVISVGKVILFMTASGLDLLELFKPVWAKTLLLLCVRHSYYCPYFQFELSDPSFVRHFLHLLKTFRIVRNVLRCCHFMLSQSIPLLFEGCKGLRIKQVETLGLINLFSELVNLSIFHPLNSPSHSLLIGR